jgi:uncharacterized protein YbgA (DUF1722 family)
MGELATFHEVNKLQLMAHSPLLCRELGRLVVTGKEMNREELLARYGECFMEALSFHATVKKNTDVLMHATGRLKRKITAAETAKILDAIRRYRDRILPVNEPLELLRHHAARCGDEFLREQTYLKPHPMELMLSIHG